MQIAAALVAATFAASVRASLYDPHLPKGSPWFEGWYSRISQTSTGVSVGVITGYYPDASGLKDPSAYVALMVDSGKGETKVYESWPKHLEVRAKGRAVVSDPEQESPPDFSISDSDGVIHLRQSASIQTLTVNFPAAGVNFSATISDPEPWGPHGESPEGWVDKLPIVDLHWFVYSLHSAATFELTTPSTGTVKDAGRAHQEKNWGTSFPKSWIWAEAVGPGPLRLALAGGPSPIGPAPIVPFLPKAYLLGYRSEKLHWNFHPQDPTLFQQSMDACKGEFNLTATSATQRLVVSVRIDPSKLGGLFTVGGPTMTGFRGDSVESYRAKMTVQAFSGFKHEHLEETTVFDDAALEFGGLYRCQETAAGIDDRQPIALLV